MPTDNAIEREFRSHLETLKRHTAELQAALNGISDSASGFAYFRTELDQALQVLRQANNAIQKLRRAAFGWALLGGLLGGLAAAWFAVEFLGR